MQKIIYRSQDDAENFDLKRFTDSLKKYAKISEKDAEEALADFKNYDVLHVSCLVEAGTQLIAKKADQKSAEEYFNAHAEHFDEGKFERLRRITGYLVGTTERWNSAKLAELKDRVTHTL